MSNNGEEIGQEEKKWNPFGIMLKMRREAPQFRRCCLCLPLRRGLISWGYIKLVLDIAAVSVLIYILTVLPGLYINLIIQVIFTLIDALFNIALIMGGHRKSINLLKTAYFYNFVYLVVLLLSCGWSTYQVLMLAEGLLSVNVGYEFILWISLPGLCLHFTLIFVQLYLILLIRSEMLKLEEQSLEMQFTNPSAAEAQCMMHILSDRQTTVSTDPRADATECATSCNS